MFRCPRCQKSELGILCPTVQTAFVNEDEDVMGGRKPEYQWTNSSTAYCTVPGCRWAGRVEDLRDKVTCTPYEGGFTLKQQELLLDLLWACLPKVPGKDQVETGFGTKTKTGLLKTIEGITNPPSEPGRRK